MLSKIDILAKVNGPLQYTLSLNAALLWVVLVLIKSYVDFGDSPVIAANGVWKDSHFVGGNIFDFLVLHYSLTNHDI